MRRKCLAIGVSRAEDLTPLYAAASAADEICEWARVTGFAAENDVIGLTDREGEEPVTIPRIRRAIEALLPRGAATDTFLLFFAGHGLREDNTRSLWLPTDWRSELRAISVERLKNRLYDYGIGNLTIIGDACKTLPVDRDTSDLTADAVLGLGPSVGRRPILDRYDAVHDIDAAFMIPGATPAESRCLFSGAVLEGLWGLDAKAFDASYPDKVTPGSLSDFVEARVAQLCKTYRLQCAPQNIAGRPVDHLIYFDRTRPLHGEARTEVLWPAPVKPQLSAWSIVKSLGRPRGSSGGMEWIERPADTRSALPEHKRNWLDAREEGEAAHNVRVKARAKRAGDISAMFAGVSSNNPYENLILAGDDDAQIWSQAPLHSEGAGRWTGELTHASEQILVEYADGTFVPAVIYPHLATIVARDQDGAAGWICLELGGSPHDMTSSLDVMNRFRNGEISPSAVDDRRPIWVCENGRSSRVIAPSLPKVAVALAKIGARAA